MKFSIPHLFHIGTAKISLKTLISLFAVFLVIIIWTKYLFQTISITNQTSLPYECPSITEIGHSSSSRINNTLVNLIRKRHLTYHSNCSLQELMSKIIQLECEPRVPREAIIIEAGVGAGGSGIAIASVKDHKRQLVLFDTFEGLPPPSERDGDDVHRRYQAIQRNKGKNNGYYGNIPNLRGFISEQFKELGYPISNHYVTMQKGLFQKEIPEQSRVPVMFVNLDGDWYDSVYTVLDRIASRVVTGGVIYVDDYGTFSGATKATDDFLAQEGNMNKWNFTRAVCGRVYLTKLSQ